MGLCMCQRGYLSVGSHGGARFSQCRSVHAEAFIVEKATLAFAVSLTRGGSRSIGWALFCEVVRN
jgi:hypothetical protein